MKNKILLALAVLVLVFSLTGCEITYEEKDFVGTWLCTSNGSSFFDAFTIYIDGTFEQGPYPMSQWDGTWFCNGDTSITLVFEYGDSIVATRYYDSDCGKDYLLINSEKYWKQ